MKKKAYSLLSMALSLLLIMGTVAVPVMAENELYKSFATNAEQNFDALTAETLSSTILVNAGGGSVALDSSVKSGDAGNSLKLAAANGQSPKITMYDSATASNANDNYRVEVGFDFYVSNIAEPLEVGIDNSGGDRTLDRIVVRLKNGKIYAPNSIGTEIEIVENLRAIGQGTTKSFSYAANKWYRLELVIDTQNNRSVNVRLTDLATNAFQEGHIAKHDGLYNGGVWRGVKEINIGYIVQKAASDATIYIDNYMHKAAKHVIAKDILSTLVYDFSENLGESAYIDMYNSGDVTTDGRDIRIEEVTDKNGITKSALTLNPVRESGDSTAVPGFYQLITYNSSTYQTRYAIDFSICRADETTAYYGLMGFNGDGGYNYELVGFNGGYITMFGNPVAKYNVNEWLNVQFRIDCNTKTATLKLRPANSNSDADWKTYKTSFNTVPRVGYTTYNTDIMATNRKGFGKIIFGSYVGAPAAQKNMKIAISDLCQNSHADTIDPGFDSVNDDFERVSVETVAKTISDHKMDNNKDDAVNANKNVWLTTDATDTTFSIDALGEENHALKAVTASESAKSPALYCVPFTLNADIRHHISLKLGGTQKIHGEYVFRLYYSESHNLTNVIYDYKYWDAVKIGKNQITVNGVTYNVALPENELCDIDVIYDSKSGMAVVRVQANGQTLCEIDKDNLYIDHKDHWNWHVKGISIMNTNATDDTMYVDDFVWDVQERTAGTATASYLADGKTEGYLDEEVSLTLNAPVLDEKMIGASAVTAGGIVIPAYTTKTSEDKKTVTVKFKDLTPNTEYTVNVFAFSDAETLIPTVGTTAAFTTNNITDFEVTDLDYSNGTGSATVTSGYKNPPITMLAALYDDEGKMVDQVKIAQKGETVITPGFTAEGSKVRLFVWSDLKTMIPYMTEEFTLN